VEIMKNQPSEFVIIKIQQIACKPVEAMMPQQSTAKTQRLDPWVSEFEGMPDLDVNANAVAIQRLELENEGWEGDCR